MRTRLATAADHEFLRELHHAAYREVVMRQFGVWDERAQDGWFEAGLANAEFRIVEAHSVPIGAIGVKRANDHIFIQEMQVLPAWQNRGIGSALLALEMERAAAQGLAVRLRVLRENRARGLYERNGFVVTGETETHFLMAAGAAH